MTKRIATFVAALALVSSCGLMAPVPLQMYAGDSMPIEQVAVLSEGGRGYTYVIAVDGQNVMDRAAGFTKGLHVRPGAHKVKVRYHNVNGIAGGFIQTSRSEGELELNAEAGHTYVIRSRRGGKVEFWFEDKGVGYNQECLAPEPYMKKYIKGEHVPGC